ncbi:MAG TPA: 2-amino-4-hydroxy-6-hydroxymethyldihydropteridine diphosphokinase [Pirellulales bacterium]|nr:2-amino-4-hydroxy-6-hydroxymethyldihydropteridine diphosphokinase [Pirellulales bacterium]
MSTQPHLPNAPASAELALVGLGANLGDRRKTLENAIAALRAAAGVEVLAVSRWHETEPIGGPSGQANYLNGAALLRVQRSPSELLSLLHQIEAQFGRVRTENWGPRTLDLDLLLYGTRVIETADLVVPHPRLAERRFVLAPAAEIAPTLCHPVLDRTIAELLAALPAEDER